MATLFEWNDGTAPTTAGSSVTVDNTVGYPATPGLLIQQGALQVAVARWDFTAQATLALRFYLHTPAAWPSAAQAIAAFKVGGTSVVAQFAFAGTGAPGQVRLVRTGGTTVVQSANGTIAVDTTYRVELQLDTAGSRARTAVFPIESDTPAWDSGWQTHTNFAVSPSRVEVGSVNANPTVGTYWVDTILGTDSAADWIGRAPGDGAGPSFGMALTIWNGTSEVPAILTYWDGATETPYTLDTA